MADHRPKTVVLLQHTGIGDLIWHVRYCEAIARLSLGGKITLVAQPSSMARQLLEGSPWIEQIIDHDHRPRRSDRRRGRHAGWLGMWRMGRELNRLGFDRIILCSGRSSRGLIALFSGIPERLGYGYRFLQRLCLSHGPFISAYKGLAQPIYPELTRFMLAHGFCESALVPEVRLEAGAVKQIHDRLQTLVRPIVTLAIGTSEVHKQWGADNFRALAIALLANGSSVVLLGGPGETALAEQIIDGVPVDLRNDIHRMTDTSIQESGAVLQNSSVCVGNDTGMVNLAAAVGCQTFLLMGPRPPLEHDPVRLHNVRARSLAEISVESVTELVCKALASTPPEN